MLTELFAKYQDSQTVDKTEDKDLLSDLEKLADLKTRYAETQAKSIALLKFLLGDASSDEPISELKNAKNFLDKVIKYMEENPGLLAGIGKKDSDILLLRPSASPSETTALKEKTNPTPENNL